MNKRIRELFKKAGGKTSVRNLTSSPAQVVETHELWGDHIEKFAELILQEHVELLKQRWYTLNNAAPENNETPRDIGMRVGQKAEVAHCIHLLSNHWKDRSDDPTEERQRDS